MLTETQIKNTRKWIAALRSGKYQQGQFVLKSHSDKYCCLGVACAINPETAVQSVKGASSYWFSFPFHLTNKNDLTDYSSVPNETWFTETFGFEQIAIPFKYLNYEKLIAKVKEKNIEIKNRLIGKLEEYFKEAKRSPETENSIYLFELNDSYELTFPEIADFIEEYLEKLIEEQS